MGHFLLLFGIQLLAGVYTLNKDEIKQCVAANNKLRALHKNTGPVQWDKDLAAAAQKYADKLVDMNRKRGKGSRVILKHDDDAGKQGENLFWGDNRKQFDCVDATLSWYKEFDNYDYKTASRKNKKKAIGHFTQVVWKGTTKIGVGIATMESKRFWKYGNREQFIVARYLPRGNIHYKGRQFEHYTENVQPRVSGVKTPTKDELVSKSNESDTANKKDESDTTNKKDESDTTNKKDENDTTNKTDKSDEKVVPKPKPSKQCKNKKKACKWWMNKGGYKCKGGKYERYFKKNCYKTCYC